MHITIVDAQLAETDMLNATVQRALHFESALACTIYVRKRVDLDAPEYQNPGWLEYGLKVEHPYSVAALYIGCIQRKPGEPIEFHS